jgi:hypothetical protein
MSTVTLLAVINEASPVVTRPSTYYKDQSYFTRDLIVYDKTDCIRVRLSGDESAVLATKEPSHLVGHPVLLRNVQTGLTGAGDPYVSHTRRSVVTLDPSHLPETAKLMEWAMDTASLAEEPTTTST